MISKSMPRLSHRGFSDLCHFGGDVQRCLCLNMNSLGLQLCTQSHGKPSVETAGLQVYLSKFEIPLRKFTFEKLNHFNPCLSTYALAAEYSASSGEVARAEPLLVLMMAPRRRESIPGVPLSSPSTIRLLNGILLMNTHIIF